MPSLCRSAAAIALVVLGTSAAGAQAAGPLVLLLPVSARAASLGNAWVAGRDEYAIFSNPAQLVATPGFAVSGGLIGDDTRTLAAVAGVVVGPVTLGWGVHLVDFSTPRSNADYPHSPSVLAGSGDAELFSALGVVAGHFTFKRFRIGLSGKYAQDVAARESSTSGLLVVPRRGAVALADVGVARPLWSGVAAFSLQNIGQPYALGGSTFSVPTQATLGWSAGRAVGPLDLGYTGQASLRRNGWVGPAAGVEAAWSWIEGYSVAGRVGARRTETDDEKPVGVGAGFTADRLTLDYAINIFAGNAAAHRITVRWR